MNKEAQLYQKQSSLLLQFQHKIQKPCKLTIRTLLEQWCSKKKKQPEPCQDSPESVTFPCSCRQVPVEQPAAGSQARLARRSGPTWTRAAHPPAENSIRTGSS